MKNNKLSVLIVLALVESFITLSAVAAGFETLPTSGSSAYVSCRALNGVHTTFPTIADSACLAPNAISGGVSGSLLFSSIPEAGFILVNTGTFSSSITAFGGTLATLNERVWINTNTGECIYGKQILMSTLLTNDFNPYYPNSNYMEVNDFAFGGYIGAVKGAYAVQHPAHGSVFRIGRTFTSVQRQTNSPSGPLCTGFLQLPISGGVLGTEINGVGAVPTCSVIPSSAQQEAPISANWVDFSTYTTAGTSPDGLINTARPASPNIYIKQECASGNTSLVSNSLKLRQTGRIYQPWVVVTATSHAPNTTVTP